jgi:hypothetical protein
LQGENGWLTAGLLAAEVQQQQQGYLLSQQQQQQMQMQQLFDGICCSWVAVG